MQVIEGPVQAVIVSYERNVAAELDSSKFKEQNYVPFYMKQTDVLDDACGLIAMLHAIGNNRDSLNFSEGSLLPKFFETTKSLSSEERAKSLESNEEFRTQHHQFASQGQSNLLQDQSQVKNHFVCFVYYQRNLVELDGLIKGPYVVKENIQPGDLLDTTIEEIKKRLENQNITENLALMYLGEN